MLDDSAAREPELDPLPDLDEGVLSTRPPGGAGFLPSIAKDGMGEALVEMLLAMALLKVADAGALVVPGRGRADSTSASLVNDDIGFCVAVALPAGWEEPPLGSAR